MCKKINQTKYQALEKAYYELSLKALMLESENERLRAENQILNNITKQVAILN